MKTLPTLIACVLLSSSTAMAQLARNGGGTRTNVQNRSTNVNRNATVNQNANVNRNTNVNRNVNVNQNVNVNRNVNVSGGCCYYHDNDWNWGSFAAGAAVGVATTAVVASAAHSSTTAVVAVGTVVPALPGGCATVATGGSVIYKCSNVYYSPYYQGTALSYRVVTYP